MRTLKNKNEMGCRDSNAYQFKYIKINNYNCKIINFNIFWVIQSK